MKDTDFYNAESAAYSAKRYPSHARTFTQFFFKERLRITLDLLQQYMPAARPVSLLEIGCADGVVARAIWQRFGSGISPFKAIDIAPQMIAVAQKNNTDTPIDFSVRSGVRLEGQPQCIVEVGVLNYLQLREELDAVTAALPLDGVYICSVSGLSSLQTSLKGAGGFRNLHSYAQYEEEFAKRFKVDRIVPVGIFVPWLWKAPAIARVLQPIIDRVVLAILPNLAHEKIYVLTTAK